jgi:hypothetical protein
VIKVNPYLTFVIACYAAVVSTLALCLNIAKWKSDRLSLRLSVSTGMRSSRDPKRPVIVLTVQNMGGRTTTITNVSIEVYRNHLVRILRRSLNVYIASTPSRFKI